MPQCDIVNHFKSLQSGALIFTQSTLSRKLKERLTLEARIKDNPNALSSKRPRIVTRPDVDRALFLWIKQMEEKGEHVNGPMLKEKR
jgi:copper oxidase (laccase) domain-containing protein